MGISIADAAYVAGLFDGEGSVYFKRMKQKKHQRPGKPVHNVMVIRMEIAMTDKSILVWVHEVLGVGTVNPKRYKTKYTVGWKKQWRWRCQHRDAYLVSCALFPYAHVKLDKIQKIIDHYASRDLKIFNNKVVSLDEYKEYMSLE